MAVAQAAMSQDLYDPPPAVAADLISGLTNLNEDDRLEWVLNKQ